MKGFFGEKSIVSKNQSNIYDKKMQGKMVLGRSVLIKNGVTRNRHFTG